MSSTALNPFVVHVYIALMTFLYNGFAVCYVTSHYFSPFSSVFRVPPLHCRGITIRIRLFIFLREDLTKYKKGSYQPIRRHDLDAVGIIFG